MYISGSYYNHTRVSAIEQHLNLTLADNVEMVSSSPTSYSRNRTRFDHATVPKSPVTNSDSPIVDINTLNKEQDNIKNDVNSLSAQLANIASTLQQALGFPTQQTPPPSSQ